MTIPDATARGSLFAAPTDGGGAVIGYQGTGGVVLTRVDGSGARVTEDVSLAGNAIYGLATHDGVYGALIFRGSDILDLVSVDALAQTRFETRLLGDVPHDVTNNEWFGSLIRDGRLAWTGTQWAAYYTVQRLWNDGVAHYGDQLVLVDDDGTEARTVWGWGCSHSMEVRIAHNGSALGPVCESDCYPTPGGVHFNHRTFVYGDSAADCRGGYGNHLGGIVSTPDGFVFAFSASDDRAGHDAALVPVTGSAPGEVVWITDGETVSALHLGAYGDGFVAAWNAGGAAHFLRLSSDLTPQGDPIELPASLSGASDFFSYANGDLGWAERGSAGLSLARLQLCE